MTSPGAGYIESPESRALRSINLESYDYKDQTKFMSKMASDVSYMSSYMRKMQQGIDSANQNVIQQIQSLINDFIVLIGGFNGATGFEWGDLGYVFQAFGALFGFDELTGLAAIFPINLFAAAWHFVSTYIFSVPDFPALINQIIDAFLATIVDALGDVPIIGEIIQQLAVIIGGIRDTLFTIGTAFWGIITQITGDISETVANAVNFISKFLTKVFETFIQPVINAVGYGIGSVGAVFDNIIDGAADIVRNIGTMFGLANGANTKATMALENTRPLWESLDGNGETSVPLSVCDLLILVDDNNSRGSLIRCRGNDEKVALHCIISKSGTVSAVYFDIYRLEGDGSATHIHSTTNQVANIYSTETVLPIEFDEADYFPTDANTYYLVMCRMEGSGNLQLQGREFPAATSATRPLYSGVLRDPVGSPAPSTFSASSLDSWYTPITPYFQLSSTGDKIPQSFFVDFSAFSDTLWIKRQHRTSGLGWPSLRANGGALEWFATNGSDPFHLNLTGYAGGVYRYPVATTNCRAGMRLKETPDGNFGTFLMLFARLDFSSWVGLKVNDNGTQLVRGTSVSSSSVIETNTSLTLIAGDWVYLEYDDTDELFRVYRNPVWTAANNRDPVSSGGHVIFDTPMSASGLSGLNITPSSRSGGIIIDNGNPSAGVFKDGPRVDDFKVEDYISPV